MTNGWNDIKSADVIVIMGGNAAEAHPCGFKWVTEAKAHNAAKLVVIDPRFTRSASVADLYCPIRQGTDIAFLNGVMRYLLTEDKIFHEYVRAYTNAVLRREGGLRLQPTACSRAMTRPSAPTTRRAGSTRSGPTALSWSTTRCSTRAA